MKHPIFVVVLSVDGIVPLQASHLIFTTTSLLGMTRGQGHVPCVQQESRLKSSEKPHTAACNKKIITWTWPSLYDSNNTFSRDQSFLSVPKSDKHKHNQSHNRTWSIYDACVSWRQEWQKQWSTLPCDLFFIKQVFCSVPPIICRKLIMWIFLSWTWKTNSIQNYQMWKTVFLFFIIRMCLSFLLLKNIDLLSVWYSMESTEHSH